jgi:predicted nucleotidyltransferase
MNNYTSLEQQLSGWIGPSSDTEQDKQERTERMVREAVAEHAPFAQCGLRIYAKGSYANNTNVRSDSDVDIAVECIEAEYWGEAVSGARTIKSLYQGIWTPAKLRGELEAALEQKFPNSVDPSGSTAIRVHTSSARVDSDVVPCFSYRYYFAGGTSRVGTKIFKRDGKGVVNYPAQQLENGRVKNQRTDHAYKRTVRILKRIENAMVQSGASKPLASYFIECLAYNCPDSVFQGATWVGIVRSALVYIWNGLEGDEPADAALRWKEANDCFYLFHGNQPWTRASGIEFAQSAWNYLGLT